MSPKSLITQLKTALKKISDRFTSVYSFHFQCSLCLAFSSLEI